MATTDRPAPPPVTNTGDKEDLTPPSRKFDYNFNSSHASRSYVRVLVQYTQPSSRKSRRRLTGAGQQPRRAGKWTVFCKREPAKVKFDR
ncbi:hypothetical protein RR46_00636 [Papilio xuthus]|uniref:Uncharacterized protein n=1 Tax=Papilio xuthus TaxID=66420 RepID=A0A0N1I4H9_PAPXU|nr:hypothetical protein RR46_00636 [Papilio xuthus]